MNAPLSPRRPCPICGSSKIAVLQTDCHYRGRTFNGLRCDDCRCLFHDLDMTQGFEYAEDYHAYHQFRWLSPKAFVLGKKTIKACLKAGFNRGILLDVGCGAGHVMRTARLLGFQSAGFDLSSPCSVELKKKGFALYDVWDQCRRALTGKCDVVTCWHTLEHVPDPKQLIADLVAMLKPGGTLSLEAPDPELLFGNYRRQKIKTLAHMATFPDHIQIPPLPWVIAQLEKHGLVIKCHYVPRDGGFYAIYERLTVRPDAPEAESPFAQDPPPLKQALAFFASFLLEPLACFVSVPVSYHIVAQKPLTARA